MAWLLAIVGCSGAVLLAAFYSGMETAGYSAGSARIELLAHQGDRRAGRAIALLRNLPVLVTTTLIGHNLAVDLGTMILTHYFEETGAKHGGIWATIWLTPFLFLFAETLPKRLAHATANTAILSGIRVLDLSRWLFYPISQILGLVAWLLHSLLVRLGYDPPVLSSRDRLAQTLEAGVEEGVLSPRQHEMARRIMAIEELTVGLLMTKHPQVFMLPERMTCREAAKVMHAAGHYRALLANEKRRLTGRMVTLNAILRKPAYLDHAVSELASPVLTLPTTMSVADALHEMRRHHSRIAVVVNKKTVPVGSISLCQLLGIVVGGLRRL